MENLHTARVGAERLVPNRWLRPLACLSLSLVTGAFAFGCGEVVEEQTPPLGGSCLACHQGITDPHPKFALACVDCHGGNDQVIIDRSQPINLRDQDLMRRSHVVPQDPTLWWANGMDDDEDGEVDEPGEFFDGRLIKEGFLAPEGQLDAEMNKDLNYLRFINPGDLKVAGVGCGARNGQANDAMVCHAEVVYDTRRSMMAMNSGVPTGATYGNAQDVKASAYGPTFEAEFGEIFDSRDPRFGRIGYVFNYGQIDDAYIPETNSFDKEALTDLARQNLDPDDDDFMATQAPLTRAASSGERGIVEGFTRSGNELKFPDRPTPVMQYIPARRFPPAGSPIEKRLERILGVDSLNDVELPAPVFNPVDNALRDFRAYHPLNWFGVADNFGFVDLTQSPNPDDDDPADPANLTLTGEQNNPIGRGRSTGCTACHTPYRKDGHNTEAIDRTVADNGRQVTTDLPYGMHNELGQRFYADKHEIKATVDTDTCEKCHAFVTRVDFWYKGLAEVENGITLGPYSFTTPDGSLVNVFDNLAKWENGRLVNPGEGVSEDANNNGELDEGEDVNNNGALDIPDRLARSESIDGRQPRVVYGGHNGAIRQMDVHFEAGMHCTDCHGIQDVHGDGNMYSRNWDQVEIECDDCHGTPYEPATLKTSGPNGGRDLSQIVTAFDEKWFERLADGSIVQHSRVEEGKSWRVPQLADGNESSWAQYSHQQRLESGDEVGLREFAHIAPAGEDGGLECYACHSAVQPNCFSCHLQQDVAKSVQQVWYTKGEMNDTFFQLFSYIRSPFILGISGDVEENKVTTYRSTMELHLNVAAGGTTLLHNAMFSSQDGLSNMAMNPYFPHVVRKAETKGCARCHTATNDDNAVLNDHLITEAVGQSANRYENIGDWAIVASDHGLEVVDVKKELRGDRNVYPGFLFDDANNRAASIALPEVNDVAFVRGVSSVNGGSEGADLALVAHKEGLAFVEVTGRDAPGFPPTLLGNFSELGTVLSVAHPETSGSQFRRAVVVTEDELATVDFVGPLARFIETVEFDAGPEEDGGVDAGVDAGPDGGSFFDDDDPGAKANGAALVGTTLAHGLTNVSRVRLFGTTAYLLHAEGVTLVDVAASANEENALGGEPGAPVAVLSTLRTDRAPTDILIRGRFAFVSTGAGGVEIFDLPSQARVSRALSAPADRADSRGLALWGTRLLVADGINGLRVIDIAIPSAPLLLETIKSVGSRGTLTDVTSVVTASEPARTYALMTDGVAGLVAINLTDPADMRKKYGEDSLRFALSFERQDPLTPFDPKNVVRQAFRYPTVGRAFGLTRGHSMDRLADANGNRLRDGWLLGADAIDSTMVERMKAVTVKVAPGTRDHNGDGLGCVARDFEVAQVTQDDTTRECAISAP